jgi:hypothetical protein
MKSSLEIMDRALVCILVSDRAWLESVNPLSRVHPVEEREQRRIIYDQVIDDRGLRSMLTQRESAWFKTSVDAMPRDQVREAFFEYSCIGTLLWCAGVVSMLPLRLDGDPTDYHPILVEHRMPGAAPSPEYVARAVSEVSDACEMAAIWHWRCKEASLSGNRTVNVARAIVELFGEDYVRLLREMPINERSGDLEVEGKAFGEVHGTKLADFCLDIRWRHHAFEWVLNEETWEHTTTDT